MNKKSVIISVVVLVIVIGVGYLFAKKSGYVPDNTPGDIGMKPMTQDESIKYKLVDGTFDQKEEALTNILSRIQKFRVVTIPKEEQTDIASITPYIPSIIEAILDDTPLPRHEDTGWGNVYHFAATIMNTFAYKIDGVQRAQDPKFGFWDSVGTADETARKSVHDNWLKWWGDNKDKLK